MKQILFALLFMTSCSLYKTPVEELKQCCVKKELK